jgi:hypothetical protein
MCMKINTFLLFKMTVTLAKREITFHVDYIQWTDCT